jgi:hypothetical protein
MIILTDSFDGTKNKLFTYKKKNKPRNTHFCILGLVVLETGMDYITQNQYQSCAVPRMFVFEIQKDLSTRSKVSPKKPL